MSCSVVIDEARSLRSAAVETCVLPGCELASSRRSNPVGFFHFRDRDGAEVDIVLEQGATTVGVEVKAAALVNDADLRGLRKLRPAAGRRFGCGAVLYDGTATAHLDDRLYAVPIRQLWEPS